MAQIHFYSADTKSKHIVAYGDVKRERKFKITYSDNRYFRTDLLMGRIIHLGRLNRLTAQRNFVFYQFSSGQQSAFPAQIIIPHLKTLKMNVLELLNKRVLVASKGQGFLAAQTVEEIKILEVSPSGNWVKIQNQHGNKIWKNQSDIILIEILEPTGKPGEYSLSINPSE
jgi:hypothetical protein